MNNSYIEIPTITSVKLKPGKSDKEIADLASDLVYGAVPSGKGSGIEDVENLSIDSYPQDGSREHKLLHGYYRLYNGRKEQQELANTPLEIVKTWDKDKQQRWFTAQMNKGAANVLPPMLGVMSAPWALAASLSAPVATTLGFGGGMAGSKIGSDIGRKTDVRRHGYTNRGTMYGLAGGLVGGLIGGSAGAIGDAVIRTKFPGVLPPVKANALINDGDKHYYSEYPDVQAVLKPTTGNTVYTGLKLDNSKAAQFADDVNLLKYYAQNQTKIPESLKQVILDYESYVNPKVLGEGAESEVHFGYNNIGQKPFVVKLLKDDLVSAWRYGSDTPPVL